MSDYLGNLAARSLDPAGGAVRPRLASWFEAVPSVSPAFLEPAAAPAFFEETVEERLAPAPEPARRPAPQRRRTRRAEPVEEEGMEVVGAAVPAPAVAVSLQGRVARRGALPFEVSPPGPLSRGERGNVAGAGVAHPDRPQPRMALQPPTRPDLSVSSPLSPRERGPGGEASKGTLPQQPQPLKRETPPPILHPQVTVLERQPPPVRRETPAPAPTIQVTIGRIEVRATPAPKAPVVERQAARPAVDLEEYLRQRSKGTGR